MSIPSSMRDCLVTLDVEKVRRIWEHVAPHLSQPESDDEALVCLHLARTSAESLPAALRLYSHQWLEERNIPSQLPPELRPGADCPQIVSAVGIAVAARDPDMEPLAKIVREAMETGVWDAVEDGRLEDSPYVKWRMAERRKEALDKLFGGFDDQKEVG